MATLNVTIKEELTLNGSDKGAINTSTSTVTQLDHRILDVLHDAEQSVLLFGAAVAAGTIKDATLKYLRITNLDSTNFVTLRIAGASEEYFVKVEALDSFILNNSLMDANAAGSASVNLLAIDEIKVQANTATCSIEIYAAA